ncbi:SDR family oxidoreductase [Rugamonas sp.]|uniref:SDR family oxidoreductase n=1 Tax=Rugamonas sp. TaxID=1926287 RepID=UPI0025F8A4DB|nr:SDR family oxidoreductase [Rugamonas sp.]
MKIKDAVVLVTGANRGLGLAYAQALLAGGAKKVYAAARDPADITLPGVVPLRLDVTDAAQVAAAAAAIPDLTLLINNAGIARRVGLMADHAESAARDELDTNLFGPLRLARAFAPALKANGGGAIVNVLSVLSWISVPGSATYCVSKAAAWSMTNGLRNELREQGTQVVAVHMAFMDTDMASHLDVAKTSPHTVAAATLEALEQGGLEVLIDEITRKAKAGLSLPHGVYLGAA